MSKVGENPAGLNLFAPYTIDYESHQRGSVIVLGGW